MDTTIDQQVEMDEALIRHAKRLRIGRSNFRLLSDISSKESTLKLVYDVLHLIPFFKDFLVIADVSEIYMQEFWTTATVHHHSIRFKMENKKHIVNLESFRNMLHICPRLPGQSFVEPPFEEEILAFLRFLRHSGAIRKLTDVNINKLHQPWRSFAAIINKFLTGKSSGYDSLRWNTKIQRKAMRCIILGSRRHQNMQQFGALLPIEHTNEDIRNSNAYQEYYAVAIGAIPPKPKASVRKTRSSSDTTVTPLTAIVGPRLSTSAKGKQPAKTSKAKTLSALSEEDEGDDDEDDEEKGGNDEQATIKEEFIHPSLSTHTTEETRDEESFDPISKTPEDSDDEANGEENLGINIGREEGHDEKEEEDELYKDVNINQGRGMESIFETTLQMDTQTPTSANFSEFMQTNQFAGAVSSIPGIVQQYMDQRMNEAVKVAIQIQSDCLRNEAQKENDEFLKTIDENMQKIIKEQVKEQVKVQVSKFLPKIEQTVNEQLEAKALTRSSHLSKTSYVVAVDLYEMEQKKILIEKIEGNKDVAMMMLIMTKNPLLDQTGGPRDAEKEMSLSQQELQRKKLPGALASQQKGLNLDKGRQATTDQLDWVNPEGQQYPHNLLKPLPLIPDSRGRRVIPFYHFINNDLEYLCGGALSRKYTTSVTKTKAEDYRHIKWIEDLVPRTMWIQEPIGYDKHAL
uniref:Retrovirus-related Pol polyprotein from transposon TNT 1-94 n=1 Tax=Tanacetum cinerariifolium TaxID=118510 RepID=A0A6L2LI79_TANCI|nr:hypothetical protein [Tanacetum cinerariifolium]